MSPALPKYSECQYSLFISFAHRDDTANNDWVRSLQSAIYKRLDYLTPDIPKLEIHFSAENGPAGGQLGFELEDRVKKSFGMLLVVGQKYVESEWCEKELDLFSKFFGPEGARDRLYIAVMSEGVLKTARNGRHWKQVVAPDQLYVEMFDPEHKENPLDNKMTDGSPGFPPLFFTKARKIADKLIKAIICNVDEANATLQGEKAGPSIATSTPWSAASSQQRHIVIGPCTDYLLSKAEMLRDAIAQTHEKVTLLPRSVIDNYDPDNGTPLRSALKDADVLVVPISDGKPLMMETDGGHATILIREWTTLNKPLSIVWYRPDDIEIKAEDKAATRHLKIFGQLAPVCASEKAVANLVLGPSFSSAVKIYIENHKVGSQYYQLANRLCAAWNSLSGCPDRPKLKCEMLDLNALELMSKDAAGVVLLLPQGIKALTTLKDQQKVISDYFNKASPVFPGCVALLFKQEGKSASGVNWPLLEFIDSGQSPTLEIDKESQPWLDAFLIEVLEQYRSNAPSLQS